jgi:hypothetical protein
VADQRVASACFSRPLPVSSIRRVKHLPLPTIWLCSGSYTSLPKATASRVGSAPTPRLAHLPLRAAERIRAIPATAGRCCDVLAVSLKLIAYDKHLIEVHA